MPGYHDDDQRNANVEDGAQTPEAKLRARRAVDPRRPAPRDHEPKRETFAAYGTRPIDVEFDGHIYEVIPTVLDDWEVVEQQARGGMNAVSMIDQYVEMLGQEGYDELKTNVRERHGYVSANVMGGFMEAVQRKVDSGN